MAQQITTRQRKRGLHRAAPPRRRLRTFSARTILGTILPGSGLMLSGHPLAGGILLTLTVLGASVIIAAALVIGPTKAAVIVAADPTLLVTAAVILMVFVLLVIASVIWTADVNWPTRGGAGRKFLAGLLATVLVLALVAPTARAVQYVFITSDVMAQVFSSDRQRSGFRFNLAGSSWKNQPRVNVLLVGSDAEPDRPGTRTDSIMMASVDTQTGETLLLSVPRNLENAPFPPWSPMSRLYPEGFNCGSECLLNEVWNTAEENAHLYPGVQRPGLEALSETLAEITGLTPDYAVVINMAGFQALVNAMGGVTLNVKDRVPIGGKVENGQIVPGSIRGWIEPGVQHLDGYHAMWYARGRATTDDFNRMGRQRCMVNALVQQVDPWTMIDRFPEVAQVVNENVYTDIPQDHLPAFAELVELMRKGGIHSLSLNSQVINVANPNFPHIREMVQASMFKQPLPTPTMTDGAPTPRAFLPTPTKAPTTGSSTPGSTSTGAPTTDTGNTWLNPAPTQAPTDDAGLVDTAAAC